MAYTETLTFTTRQFEDDRYNKDNHESSPLVPTNPKTAHDLGAVSLSAPSIEPSTDQDATTTGALNSETFKQEFSSESPSEAHKSIEIAHERESYEVLADALVLLKKTELGLATDGGVSDEHHANQVATLKEEVRQRAADAIGQTLPSQEVKALIEKNDPFNQQVVAEERILSPWILRHQDSEGHIATPEKARLVAMAWDMTNGDPSLGAGLQFMIHHLTQSETYKLEGEAFVTAFNRTTERHQIEQSLPGPLKGGDLRAIYGGGFNSEYQRAYEALSRDIAATSQKSKIAPNKTPSPSSDAGKTTGHAEYFASDVEAYSKIGTEQYTYPLIHDQESYQPQSIDDALRYHIEKPLDDPLAQLTESIELYHALDTYPDPADTAVERQKLALSALYDAHHALDFYAHSAEPSLTLGYDLVKAIDIVNMERPDLLRSLVRGLRTTINYTRTHHTWGTEHSLSEVERALNTFEANGRQDSLQKLAHEEVIATQRAINHASAKEELQNFENFLDTMIAKVAQSAI